MNRQELIPHLFRTEYSKIVSVLCKTFGFSQIALAEDIASETFLTATETWGLKGTPKNPRAWLYQVAKNKARDGFRHNKVFQQKIKPELEHRNTTSIELEIDLSEPNIKDSQLQMLFAICTPIISKEAQIALALRILCGFGVTEIAKAFLSNKETINKRLHRAKEKLRAAKIDLGIPHTIAIEERLDNVISVVYLLYNEGYYSTTSEINIRKELCIEAMRLSLLLLDHEPTNLPKTNALMALFCFHASRFEARSNKDGEQTLYFDQDIGAWDQELIKKGVAYLRLSSLGTAITKYHLEAVIAYQHTQPNDSKEKWGQILQLYNQLLQLRYSPIIALNRTYALSKAYGKQVALEQALKIDMKNNHFYHLLLAELYSDSDRKKQKDHLELAMVTATTDHEKKIILRKLDKAKQNGI
ncbi:sigma-70 family RNA polymerase sigma factor [Flavobacteriaceae bacterium TP-CH-4]|uniref:Sigma-70 family RNA polymerase sigma factor n=1 Tax=Pelagihabitans pacificus TaxID=2696054 RepID=A0A967EAI3_9FLAO|nr:sigma-70 family RNA polymerase sigma factor [Pelagihabitans pacificus]NHF59476.1 sigma-70 family RNA polymerase sigma factor [Pelagihabitans pacificus]